MSGEPSEDGHLLVAQQRSARMWVGHATRTVGGIGVAYIVAHAAVRYVRGDAISPSQMAFELPAFLLFVGLLMAVTTARPISRHLRQVQERVDRAELARERETSSRQFLNDVGEAFEMAETPDDLYAISGVALGRTVGCESSRSEILIADSSGAHIDHRVTNDADHAPGCGVRSPAACPAVRRGQTLSFSDPDALSACPHLRNRELDDGLVATCIPVTVLGTASAVLHSIHQPDVDHQTQTALEGVAVRFGARLGMLRAMAKSQLQADTDPLTGLLNRRAMENATRELQNAGRRYAVAMLDLDHFKDLNDTFGHDTGDRSLRMFARVLGETARSGDIVSRHGGEEFVMILPDTDVVGAAPVLHRLRERLSEEIKATQLPPFTVSIGLADSTWSNDLLEQIKAADRALLQAKRDGRNRLVIDSVLNSDVPAEASR